MELASHIGLSLNRPKNPLHRRVALALALFLWLGLHRQCQSAVFARLIP